MPPGTDRRRCVRCEGSCRHDWQALTLALFSLGTATALWDLIYVFTYRLALVVLTVSKSFNADTLLEVNDPNLVGPQFGWWFLVGATMCLVAGWTARRRLRLNSLREARYYLLWVVAELLMAAPNVTFSVCGNLRALVRIRPSEAADAWRLLESIKLAGGRLSAASLRLEMRTSDGCSAWCLPCNSWAWWTCASAGKAGSSACIIRMRSRCSVRQARNDAPSLLALQRLLDDLCRLLSTGVQRQQIPASIQDPDGRQRIDA